MPYVPGFTNDIFISFAHDDNWDGWVERFEKHLTNRLNQIGATVTIWRDKRLRGTEVFTDEIFTQLQHSALLISIVSPLGIRSPWCEDERQAFKRFAALNGGFRFGNSLRTIRVIKTPLPGDQHRDLSDVLGFEFYERDAQSDRFREFDQSSPQFCEIRDNLALDIKRVLDTFREHLKAVPRLDTVYVATSTPDLESSRNKIVQQLEVWGYAVAPQDYKQSHHFANLKAVAKAELAASIFSVHSVTNQPQRIEEGQDLNTEQYQLAQSLGRDRIVWIEPGTQLNPDFDNALKKGQQKGLEILENCSIEELKEVIRDTLDEKWGQTARSRKGEAKVELNWIRDRTDDVSEDSYGHKLALSAPQSSNPFPGLRSFEREQAPLFFGRDEQIEDLVERLGRHRLLPIMGMSGSGKSSLVRAGLIPALTGSNPDNEASRWRIVILKPGRNLMHELAEMLCREFAIPESDDVLQTLRGNSVGLARVVGQHLDRGEKLLIIVDQFEELFRYHDAADPTGEMNDDIAFVKLLLAAAGESKHPLPGFDDLPVFVVTTMRSEYLGECSRFRGLPEALNQSQYLIPRLTREQQRRVIEEPITMAGASIEPILVQRLLNEFGDDPDQLPELQHVLMRIWEQSQAARAQGESITVADYEAVGGMSGALNNDADRVYNGLSTNEEIAAITRRLFQRLVAPDNERRSPTSFSELVAITTADEDGLKVVIDEFQQRGFLTISDDRDPIVDITHESLIRGWRQLTTWVEEEKESAAIYRRLADHAAQHAQDKASLYSDPELQLTLNWSHEVRPNEAWATRYHSGFAQAIEFLEQSRKERDAALERAEQQRRRELKRIGRTVLMLCGLVLLALSALLFAVLQRNAAVAERDRSNRLLYDSGVYSAGSAIADGQFALALERFNEISDEALRERRGFEWFYLWRILHAEEGTLSGHSTVVNSVAFSPDGKTLASASGDNTVKLWDTATRQELATLTGHSKSITSVAFSPDGKTLASSSDDNTVKLWDTTAHKELATLTGHSSFVMSVAFSPDGKTLASASGDKTVRLWDTAAHKELATLTGHSSFVMSIAFSPDGKTLASASGNGVMLWDIATRKELTALAEDLSFVVSVTFSPNGEILAVGSDDTVKLWDTATHKYLGSLTDSSGSVTSVAFSPDGKTLASASTDNTVKLWDTAALKELANLAGHTKSVTSVAFSPDGKILASASGDKTAKLWDTVTRKELANLAGHSKSVMSVAISPDGKILASASADDTVKLWDTTTRLELATLAGHSSFVSAIAFSPDGKTLVSASYDHTVKLWDTATHKELATLPGHSGAVWSVAFSPDGKTLASAHNDNTVKLWDITGRKERATLSGHTKSVKLVTFSPDGKILASVSYDGTVKLWDTAALKELTTLSVHPFSITSVAFSPDGKTLASAGANTTVKLWDVATGKELATLSGHSRYVSSVTFSPDGKTLASASGDKTVKLWDTAARKELATLSGHSDYVTSVVFSPDGKILASASGDKTVRLWFAATEEEVEERRRRGY